MFMKKSICFLLAVANIEAWEVVGLWLVQIKEMNLLHQADVEQRGERCQQNL